MNRSNSSCGVPTRWRRRIVRAVAVIALAAGPVVVGLTAAGCKRSEAQAMPERPPAAVTVAQAAASDVPVYIDEIGRCMPSELVTVQPQVSGMVIKRHFEDGAEVKAGDLLFTIDPRPFAAELAEAQAMLVQTQTELDLAKREFGRTEGLIKTAAASQQEFDQRRSAVAVAEARIKAAEAAIERARLDVDYCTIRSPIDGRVGMRQVDAGNVVKMNETQLLVIQRLDPIYADFTTPERNLPMIRRHMAANNGAPLRVEVRVPNDASGPRAGDLTFLDTAVAQGAGTVKMRATLKNADRHLWGGQFVNVRLVLETKKGAVLVPQQAVQIGQNGQFVFIVKADGTADMRPIKPGQRQGDQVVVESGVQPGEQVIVTGQNMIMPGAPVRVVEPPKAAEGVAGL